MIVNQNFSLFLLIIVISSIDACLRRPRPPRPPPIPFTCGKADEIHRIVGGEEADPHSIPWQVALVMGNSFQPFCGGTIVSPYHVLTAAHCTWVPFIRVLVGEHNIKDGMHNVVRHNVQCIQNHPRYFKKPYDNDFAIITLKTPIDLSSNSTARAACLPTKEDADVFGTNGTHFTVSGWGRLTYGGDTPTVLQRAEVPYFPTQACREIYANKTDYEGLITKNMLCAGTAAGGIDSCSGDSGGKTFFPTILTSLFRLPIQ